MADGAVVAYGWRAPTSPDGVDLNRSSAVTGAALPTPVVGVEGWRGAQDPVSVVVMFAGLGSHGTALARHLRWGRCQGCAVEEWRRAGRGVEGRVRWGRQPLLGR